VKFAVVCMASGVLAIGIGHVVEDLTGQLNIIVGKLANLSIVDTENFGFLGGAKGKTGDEVHDEEDEAGSEERVETARDGIRELVTELDPVAVDPSTWNLGETIEMSNVVGSEEGSEDVANKTTNGVLGKDIEGIINTKDELELGSVVGTCGTDNTVNDGSPGWNVTGTRSNSDESGNDTRAETNSRPLAFKTVIKNTPSDASNACSQVGDNSGHDSAHVGCESGTSIETEPSNPEENGTDDNVCYVVWAVVQSNTSRQHCPNLGLLFRFRSRSCTNTQSRRAACRIRKNLLMSAVSTTFAQHNRVCESGASR
jgi:hypothetical protein